MKGKMKAQVFYEKEAMKLEEVDIPEVHANEVLVRVRACGICGSDIAYYYARTPLDTPNGKGPLILGHEFCGDVVEVGQMARDLKLFRPGDRVIANPVQNCFACPECLKHEYNLCKHTRTKGVGCDGAYAEYAVVNYTHLYRMPESMTYEEGAICEPVACATYGVSKLEIKLGDTVAIIGPGNIGLSMLQLIRAKGAEKIIMLGVLDYGLEKAREMGADVLLNTLDKSSPYYTADPVKSVSDATGGNLADKVIVPTAAIVALEQALEISGLHSCITYFGMPRPEDILRVPLAKLITMDKTVNVSWLAPNSWDEAIKAIAGKKVDASKLITHRFKLSEVEQAIRFMGDMSRPEKVKSIILMD